MLHNNAPDPDNAHIEGALFEDAPERGVSAEEALRRAANQDVPIWRSDAGVDWYVKDNNDGNLIIQGAQDVYDLLELNKAMFTENDGWSKGEKFMRRAASIPHSIRLKWLVEEGWDAWRADLYWDRLQRKLNDPDWRYLRTADWRV